MKRFVGRDLRGEGIASCGLAPRLAKRRRPDPYFTSRFDGVLAGVGSIPCLKSARVGLGPRLAGEIGEAGGDSVCVDWSDSWRARGLRGVGRREGAFFNVCLVAETI